MSVYKLCRKFNFNCKRLKRMPNHTFEDVFNSILRVNFIQQELIKNGTGLDTVKVETLKHKHRDEVIDLLCSQAVNGGNIPRKHLQMTVGDVQLAMEIDVDHSIAANDNKDTPFGSMSYVVIDIKSNKIIVVELSYDYTNLPKYNHIDNSKFTDKFKKFKQIHNECDKINTHMSKFVNDKNNNNRIKYGEIMFGYFGGKNIKQFSHLKTNIFFAICVLVGQMLGYNEYWGRAAHPSRMKRFLRAALTSPYYFAPKIFDCTKYSLIVNNISSNNSNDKNINSEIQIVPFESFDLKDRFIMVDAFVKYDTNRQLNSDKDIITGYNDFALPMHQKVFVTSKL